jgi:transcriptional regulator with XRE-family HTH domain
MKLNQEKLNDLLKMYRLTTLANITDINYQTLTRLSRKSRTIHEIELKTAYKLAKGLGMTIDEFVMKVYDFE